MNKKVSVPFMLLGILFNVCLIAANILETKVIHVYGDFSVTAGLLVFPISYIINDCIVEVWGFKKARLIIWTGFAMNFFVVALGLIAVALPAAPYWEGEEHFNFIFGLAPRIVVASLIAFLAGSFLNAYVMSKMKLSSNGKNFSARAIWSTVVGESADSIIFFPIAFAGIIAWNNLFYLMALQVVLKSLYEVIVLPITIRVVSYIKKIEGTDVYDEDISYNILKIKDL
ncbi:MAG: queuosine precursor transporter [Bacteroides sp.]|nr:queuosine precursor transporter [Bacteroides sp.]MDD4720471.1 queuosine precursor transporter [Bacteroides sp.]NLI64174.1 queuosine precursor transporter [Bacteroidales bacterium]